MTLAHDWYLQVIRGRPGLIAGGTRIALAGLSPAYSGAMRLRNRLFELDWKRRVTLPRPVVSIGNITTGGTGKTPTVAWLAEELSRRGHRPAILMRGYKGGPTGGDEERLLRARLGGGVPVEADPDRAAAASCVLQANPDVSVFLLDDGFQHRRVRRQFDLVLIDATDPFGGGFVLPRGLLREPLSGLSRASAILLTRCQLAPDVEGVETTLHAATPAAVYRSRFALNYRSHDGTVADVRGRRLLVASGIGNPDALVEDVRRDGGQIVSRRDFPDHYAFSPADVAPLATEADAGGATLIVTGKDWTKLESLWPTSRPAIVAEPTLVAERSAALLDSIVAAITPRDG